MNKIPCTWAVNKGKDLIHTTNSMYFELYALSDFLIETIVRRSALVWITDNESFTWAVSSRVLLASILGVE